MTNEGLGTQAVLRYELVRELIGRHHASGARLVEFGAAPGDQSASLARNGYCVTAIDHGVASDEWGTGEEGAMVAMFADAGVEFVEWDLELSPYPLPSEQFDGVVFTEVYEHLRDYPIRSLEEAHRVLVPGGRLYFTTPNAAYLVNRAHALAGRSTATGLDDWIGGLPFARHAREYTFSEVRTLLERVGFEVELETSRHFYVGTGQSSAPAKAVKRAIDALSRARPTLGPSIVVVARKPW